MANKTGGTCLVSGIYRGNCGCKDIALSVGETFPPCPLCRKAVTYTLVRATA